MAQIFASLCAFVRRLLGLQPTNQQYVVYTIAYIFTAKRGGRNTNPPSPLPKAPETPEIPAEESVDTAAPLSLGPVGDLVCYISQWKVERHS